MEELGYNVSVLLIKTDDRNICRGPAITNCNGVNSRSLLWKAVNSTQLASDSQARPRGRWRKTMRNERGRKVQASRQRECLQRARRCGTPQDGRREPHAPHGWPPTPGLTPHTWRGAPGQHVGGAPAFLPQPWFPALLFPSGPTGKTRQRHEGAEGSARTFHSFPLPQRNPTPSSKSPVRTHCLPGAWGAVSASGSSGSGSHWSRASARLQAEAGSRHNEKGGLGADGRGSRFSRVRVKDETAEPL